MAKEVIHPQLGKVEDACQGKQVFDSFSKADRVRRERARRGTGSSRTAGEVYHCRHCGQFHIGHKIIKIHKRYKVKK